MLSHSDYFDSYNRIDNDGLQAKELVKALMDKVDEETVLRLVPELADTIGCEQKHPAHCSDVFQHTLRVVNGLPNSKILRLTALLHDIGKIETKVMGNDGIEHFWGHPEASAAMAENILTRLGFDDNTKALVVYLIQHHDSEIVTDEKEIDDIAIDVGLEFFRSLNVDRICGSEEAKQIGIAILEMLFAHQLSDLNAHSPIYAAKKMPGLLQAMSMLDRVKDD